VGPGEPWERIPADPGIDFFLKIPVGKDPGNLRVHLCPALMCACAGHLTSNDLATVPPPMIAVF